MILTKIIFEYLQSNRRITVPALGTFLSKGDDSPLLFSEFMKGDDGVLRELLCTKAGMSELESAIFVDRFVFDLRHAMESGECYTLPHLGYMSSEDGRSYAFEYDPSAGAITEQSAESEAEPIEVAPAEPSEPTPIPQPVVTEVEPATVESIEEPAAEPIIEPATTPKRARTDIWILIGVIAAVFALIAISYGVIVEWSIGNVSFGEPIDSYLERFIDGGMWESIHNTISPDRSLPSQEIIPQDTIRI